MSFVNSVIFDTDNTGVQTTAFSLGSGSNRIVRIVACHEQTNGTRPLSTLSLGGVSATRSGYRVSAGAGSAFAYVEHWYILEANAGSIPATPQIAVTPASGGSAFVSGTIFTNDGRDQNPANWTAAGDDDTCANVMSTTLAATVGSDIAGGQTAATAGFSFTTDAPLTEVATSDRNQNSGLAYRSVQFYHTSTDASTAIGGDNGSTSGTIYQTIYAVAIPPAAAGATISSGTPSGTIATQRRVTLGATSTQSTGTFYGVISATEADITGITAAQVYAGQYAGGGAATFSGNAAVTDSTPSVEITGLTPATTYYYAVMHRVGTENSNVISTGSFTTAVATSTTTLTLRDGAGALLNAQTLNFWTRTGLNTVAVDGGTSGLSVTCDASGVFTFTGLTVDAGAGFLTVQNPSDNTYSANYPVTFVAGV